MEALGHELSHSCNVAARAIRWFHGSNVRELAEPTEAWFTPVAFAIALYARGASFSYPSDYRR